MLAIRPLYKVQSMIALLKPAVGFYAPAAGARCFTPNDGFASDAATRSVSLCWSGGTGAITSSVPHGRPAESWRADAQDSLRTNAPALVRIGLPSGSGL